MMNLQPESIAQNRFEYTKILKPSELTLVNRRIKKTNSKGRLSAAKDSLSDLQKFFVLSSDDSDESKLNYFLIKRWVGFDAKKKKSKSPVIVNLSVDHYYSIYVEKKQKKGNSVMERKARFPAEKAQVAEKRSQHRIIEITYPEKGIFWTSKKKIRIGLADNEVDEFLLHHNQALTLFSQNNNITQSAIVSKTGYQDAGATQKKIVNQNDPRLVESQFSASQRNVNLEHEMADFERQFASERVIKNIKTPFDQDFPVNNAPQVSPNRFAKKKNSGNQVEIGKKGNFNLESRKVDSLDESDLGSEIDYSDDAYLSDSSVKKMQFDNPKNGKNEGKKEEESRDSNGTQRMNTEEEEVAEI